MRQSKSVTDYTNRMLAAAQIRAARGLLSWSQSQLAETSGVSLPTIKRMESVIGPGRSAVDNVQAVKKALESAGVEFIEENGGGPGVRLRKGVADQSIDVSKLNAQNDV